GQDQRSGHSSIPGIDLAVRWHSAKTRQRDGFRLWRYRNCRVARAAPSHARGHCGQPPQVALSRALLAASQDLGVACCTQGLDHLEDALANAGLADLVVSPYHLQCLALDK